MSCAVYVDLSGLDKTCMIIRDITERKHNEVRVAHYRDHQEEQVKARTDELARTNDALSLASDAADASNRAKSSFLASMTWRNSVGAAALSGRQAATRGAEQAGARPAGLPRDACNGSSMSWRSAIGRACLCDGARSASRELAHQAPSIRPQVRARSRNNGEAPLRAPRTAHGRLRSPRPQPTRLAAPAGKGA